MKTKFEIIVLLSKPHRSDPAQLVLLRRWYRRLECAEKTCTWHKHFDWRNDILLKLASAEVPLTCAYCGKKNLLPFTKNFSPSLLTIDHIIPTVRGGSNKLTNLALSCSPCNSAKKDKLLPFNQRQNIVTVAKLLELKVISNTCSV